MPAEYRAGVLKKAQTAPEPVKREFVKKDNRQLSVRRQCELLSFNRSSLSYETVMECKQSIVEFIRKYNQQRLHQSLKEYDMPLEVYRQTKLAVAC